MGTPRERSCRPIYQKQMKDKTEKTYKATTKSLIYIFHYLCCDFDLLLDKSKKGREGSEGDLRNSGIDKRLIFFSLFRLRKSEDFGLSFLLKEFLCLDAFKIPS